MIKKSCLACGEVKSIDEYGLRTRSKSGRADRCLECCRRDSRERYARNPEAGRARANRYRGRYPEKVRAAAREVARANKAQRRIDKLGAALGLLWAHVAYRAEDIAGAGEVGVFAAACEAEVGDPELAVVVE